jgi:hypothetical protein
MNSVPAMSLHRIEDSSHPLTRYINRTRLRVYHRSDFFGSYQEVKNGYISGDKAAITLFLFRSRVIVVLVLHHVRLVSCHSDFVGTNSAS